MYCDRCVNSFGFITVQECPRQCCLFGIILCIVTELRFRINLSFTTYVFLFSWEWSTDSFYTINCVWKPLNRLSLSGHIHPTPHLYIYWLKPVEPVEQHNNFLIQRPLGSVCSETYVSIIISAMKTFMIWQPLYTDLCMISYRMMISDCDVPCCW